MGNLLFSNTASTDTPATLPPTAVDSHIIEQKDAKIFELQQKLHEMENRLNKTQKKRRRSFSSISILDDSNISSTIVPYEQHSEFLVDPKLEENEDTLNLTVNSDRILHFSSPEIYKKQKLENTEDAREQMIIVISGFKQSSDHLYNRNVKKRICQYIEKLGNYTSSNGTTIPVQIFKEDNTKPTEPLDDSITHILCPPQSRTFKVLQAVLTHKWVVCPEWIIQSHKSNRWLPETSFGFKRLENPIENRSIYLAPSFDLYCTSSKSSPNYIANLREHCNGLAKTGKALFVNEPDHADYILVGPSTISTGIPPQEKVHDNKEKSFYSLNYPKVYVLEWSEFIELLYPQYLESTLRKAAEMYPLLE